MKLYVVTSGSYSDYRIKKVFMSGEKAEAFVKFCKDYGYIGDEINDNSERILYTEIIFDYFGKIRDIKTQDEYEPYHKTFRTILCNYDFPKLESFNLYISIKTENKNIEQIKKIAYDHKTRWFEILNIQYGKTLNGVFEKMDKEDLLKLLNEIDNIANGNSPF